MSSGTNFEVSLRGPRGSSEEDRRRASLAPANDLPALTPQAREAARALRMTDEAMQRFMLIDKFAVERLTDKARKLGQEIQNILSAVQGHDVRAVTTEAGKNSAVDEVKGGFYSRGGSFDVSEAGKNDATEGVKQVIAELDKPRWIVKIRTPEGDVNIAIPFQLGNDVIDSGAIQDLEQLRILLLENLAIGREFVGRRR